MKQIIPSKLIRTIKLAAIAVAMLLFLLSGLRKPKDISGHWHIQRIEDSDYYPFFSIDVMNDTTAILNRFVGFGGMYGYVDRREQTIRFGGECLALNFRYWFKNGQLVLNQEEYDRVLVATFTAQCFDVNNCNLEEEFFAEALVRVELPDRQNFKSDIDLNLSMQGIIQIGIPKTGATVAQTSSEHQLVLGDKLGSVSDIELWKEKNLVKLPEDKRDRWRVVFYADRKTPMKTIFPILRKLRTMGDKGCYLAAKTRGEEFKIIYHPLYLNELQLDDQTHAQMSLQDWLLCQQHQHKNTKPQKHITPTNYTSVDITEKAFITN